jgi:hypothetical protein
MANHRKSDKLETRFANLPQVTENTEFQCRQGFLLTAGEYLHFSVAEGFL